MTISTREGMIIPEGFGWREIPAPNRKHTTVIQETPDGYFAGGVGYLGFYDGQWHSGAVDDLIHAGFAVEQGMLASGQRKCVYLVDRSGEIQLALDLTADPDVVTLMLQMHEGQIHVSVHGTKGNRLLRWDGTHFQPAEMPGGWFKPSEFPEDILKKSIFLVKTDDGAAIFSEGKLYHRGRQVLAPEFGAQLMRETTIGMLWRNREFVMLTGQGGVYGIDDHGVVQWTAPLSVLGGSLQSLEEAPAGLLATHARGVELLPDRRFIGLRDLSGSDYIHGLQETEGHVYVVSRKGGFEINALVPETPGYFVSYLRSAGSDFAGYFGGVIKGPSWTLQLPDRSAVKRIVRVGSELVCVLDPATLFKISSDGRILGQRTLKTAVNSLATTSDGLLLAGTNEGVCVLGPDLEVRRLIGHGKLRVKTTGGRTLIFDAVGGIFDERGELLGQVECQTLFDVVWHQNRLIALLEGAGGWVAAGWVGPWRPLNIPGLSSNMRFAATDGSWLYFASSDQAVRVGELKSMKPLALDLESGFRAVPDRIELPRDEDTFMVQLPFVAEPGTPMPELRYALDGGEWREAARGVATIDRLRWGTTRITFQAQRAGLVTARTVQIVRSFPPWLTWWALSGYALGTVGGLWGLYRWRTGVLRRRAEELERRVEERTAQLAEAKRAREYFISAMSHEIRNPLNGVVGLCEMLHAEAPTPRARSLTATLQSCADQLRSMLDDVMDWSRIERGELTVASEPFTLSAALEAACRAQDPELRDVTLVGTGEGWVRGDAAKFRQIVMNLVSNGLKHGQPRGVEVTLAQATTDGLCRLDVAVANAAPTFSAREIEGFFAEYHRGADARQRQAPGLGLGLHISRRLAEAMGGRLAGHCANGRIIFTLSLALPVADTPARERETKERASRRLRLLALEDEAYNRLVLGHLAGRLGCAVDWVEDEADLRRALRETDYAGVLTDFSMPQISGLRVAEVVREMSGGKLPVIAVTAYSTEEKQALGRQAGIVEFVSKPLSGPRLAAALRRHLQDWTAAPGEATEVAEDGTAEFDLAGLALLGPSEEWRGRFAGDVEQAWRTIAADGMNPANARAVHALRARVLIVRARELAEQLALLENAIQEQDPAAVERIRTVGGRLVDRLVRALRETPS